jgi:adenylate cyclase
MVVCALIALGVFAAVSLTRHAGVLQFLELSAYDWQLAAVPAPAQVGSPVVLVEMSEEDIATLGHWPLTDEQLAELLEKIAAAAPRAIGVDIYRDVPVAPGTGRLEAVLKSHDNVFAVMKYPDEHGRGVLAPPVLSGSERVGFSDVIQDADGTVRRALLFLDDGTATTYSFALRLALRYLEGMGIHPAPDPHDPEAMQLGASTIRPFEAGDGAYAGADPQGYQFLVDYARDLATVERFDLGQVMAGSVPAERFRDRLVLVGVAAISVKDEFRIPQAGAQPGQIIPGVAWHGLVADQLIRAAVNGEGAIRSWRNWQEHLWILAWCLLGALAGRTVRSAAHLVLLGFAGVLAIAGISTVLLGLRLWIPSLPPIFGGLAAMAAMTGYRVHGERREREALMRIFSKHVSPEVAQLMWQHRAALLLGGRIGGRQLTATVLFLDFAGFTAASEALDPARLMLWLEQLTDRMSRLVMQHAGVVDDYFGDGIKANFGVPYPREDEPAIAADALNAVRCALAMSDALVELNEYLREAGLPRAVLRIGIATGRVVAGSVGSSERMKYTTVGDTVNIAARLEAFDRTAFALETETDCRILVSGDTHRLVEAQVHAEALGPLALKGKSGAVAAFRIFGHKPP